MHRIVVQDVRKSYSGTLILKDVSFACSAGEIVAFVGPNGAGKSTTMRIMCGLTHADSGEVRINGELIGSVRNLGAQVGSVLDPLAHHSGRTVYQTVRIPALMMRLPKQRAHEVIEQMGLGAVRRRRFKALSLGMKQRVSLAIALLSKPNILVLDEPMNGLDIEGIEWTRNFLRKFADEGGTVLVSSHLLNELQMFADRVVIISQGAIKTDRVIGSATDTVCRVRPDNSAQFAQILENKQIHGAAVGDGFFNVHAEPDVIARLAFEKSTLLLEIYRASSRLSIESEYKSLAQGDFTMSEDPA